MSILIKTVRVSGFRGLKNIEVELEQTTVLTGMNNTGKTSFLKALQLSLGNRQFISQEDFFIHGSSVSERIIIDLLIVPVSNDGMQCDDFLDSWVELFTTERIRVPGGQQNLIPLRTIITFNKIKNKYTIDQFILQEWPQFKQENINWFDSDNGNNTNFRFDEVPFFYMDAQRDILEDTKSRSSYLGKMLSKIEYSEKLIKEIEEQIKLVNEKAVSESSILTNIKTTLEELDTAMGTSTEGIEITPFTKKIRDLNKGLTIHYTDQQDSFTMEYHGMGTRSWSSLLMLKAFISLLENNSKQEQYVFYPIIAIEEPEAHLHPNAQKKLYRQINSMAGQKIISTHSPYIAATAKLEQIRNFYKNDNITCGRIDISDLSSQDIRKINRQVINTRGEILFSKVIVFFEGETEEQALPIFAHKYFGKTSVEMAVDFIGVGGYGNYLPFLRFAEALNIPWIIFSDAETNVKKSVISQFTKCGTVKKESDCIVFLDDGNDFDGFCDEIKLAFSELHDVNYLENEIKKKDGTKEKRIKTQKTCSACKQSIFENILRDYDGDDGFIRAIYDCMTSQKTQFGPVIAEQLIKSNKGLPTKIICLFDKVSAILNIEEIKDDH